MNLKWAQPELRWEKVATIWKAAENGWNVQTRTHDIYTTINA